jgi:putative transposase
MIESVISATHHAHSSHEMPRQRRVVIPNVPLHITQRGVDRCPTFLVDEDFAFYRRALKDALTDARCSVHAYVLMTNHVHLLATPMDRDGPARMMRTLGLRYVRYFNDRYRRSGTLWEGRFRSTVVSSPQHFFACSRYIEQNPVRARMANDPRDYAWSSVHRNAYGRDDLVVSEHPLYTQLGVELETRTSEYRELVASTLAPSVLADMRIAHRGRATMFRTPYQQAVKALLGDVALATRGGT